MYKVIEISMNTLFASQQIGTNFTPRSSDKEGTNNRKNKRAITYKVIEIHMNILFASQQIGTNRAPHSSGKDPDQSKISADQCSGVQMIEMQWSTKCDPEIILSSGFVYLLQQVHGQNTTHNQTKKTIDR